MTDEAEGAPTVVRSASGRAAPDGLEQALRDAREQSLASREILLALGSERGGSEQILDTIIDRAARLCRADVAQLYLRDGDVFQLSRISGDVPRSSAATCRTTRSSGAGPACSAGSPWTGVRSRSMTSSRPRVRPAGPPAAGRVPHPAVGADAAG